MDEARGEDSKIFSRLCVECANFKHWPFTCARTTSIDESSATSSVRVTGDNLKRKFNEKRKMKIDVERNMQ